MLKTVEKAKEIEWGIKEIEALTEKQTREMAIESTVIKEHNIYFVDFGGYFGYSCLVFKNNHHIYYANDYELHHQGKTKEELKERYINGLTCKLFTEREIAEPIKSYDEYTQKEHFLHSYYPMQTDYVSQFRIFRTEEDERQFEKDITGLTYNPVAFAYMEDKNFIKHHIELYKQLQKAKENTVNDFEYMQSAFLYEMRNHEYPINWQGNYDVLSCFGNITYNSEDDFNKYFDELNFTETQRKAYRAARQQCLQEWDY